MCYCLTLTSQDVKERLVCRGIVGQQGCNEHIMSVDVTCRFVAPVLSFSSKQLNFYIQKVGSEILLHDHIKSFLSL